MSSAEFMLDRRPGYNDQASTDPVTFQVTDGCVLGKFADVRATQTD